jgi:hypothetical protein
MHGVRDSDPDINQAQPADSATDESMVDNHLQRGVSGEQTVLAPNGSPGNHYQDHAQLDEKDNVNAQFKSLNPNVKPAGFGVRAGRVEGGIRQDRKRIATL